jgi:Calx-beta domain-containing protein
MKQHGPIFRLAAMAAIAAAQIVFAPLLFAQAVVSIVATDDAAGERLPGQSANPGMIRVSRTGNTASPLTVLVRVRGSAEQGVDYTFGGITIGGTLTIPAAQSFLNIQVIPIDDVLTEGDEDVRLELLDSPAYIVGEDDRGDVDIADNEDPSLPARALVTITAVDSQAAETLSGAAPNTATFRISRVGNLAVALNVNYTLGGSATPGIDYGALSGTIALPAGVASADLIVAPMDDAAIEGDETVSCTLAPSGIAGNPPPATAYVIGSPSNAVVTIVDNDFYPLPSVTITAPVSNAVAIVGQPVTVSFTASDVDGYIVSYSISGAGMTGASGLTGNPTNTAPETPFNGSASVTFQSAFTHVFTVQVVDNKGNVGAASRSIYVINPPPPPPPPPPVLPVINIYALDAEGAEVSGGPANLASFRVTHNFPPTNAVSFLFALSGTAKPGIDYSVAPATNITKSFLGTWFTIPAGQSESEIVITPVDDLFVENTETVTLSLYIPPFIGFTEGNTGGGPSPDWFYSFGFYFGSNSTATVSIQDNDIVPPPFNVVTIAATDARGSEVHSALGTNDPAVFTLTRIGSNTAPITVRYAFTAPPRAIPLTFPIPVMARNGVDFETLSGSVTFADGATTAQIVVNPIFDAELEPTEFVQLTLLPSSLPLNDPGSYAIDDNVTASVNIDSFALPGVPVITIRASDPHAIEDAVPRRNGSFIISRQGYSTSALTVPYQIGGSALNGVDYQTLPGFVTLGAGTNGGVMINIVPINDSIPERTEAVGLTILSPPIDVYPPPYLVANPRSAGVGIRDKLRFGQMDRLPGGIAVVPVPPVQVVNSTSAITTNTAPCWIIEASADLIQWEQIGTSDAAEAAGEVNEFIDVEAASYPQRFYRMRPCR